MSDEQIEQVAEGEAAPAETLEEKVAGIKSLFDRILYVKVHEGNPDYVKMADRDESGKATTLILVAEGLAATDIDRLLDAFIMGQVTLP